MNTAYCGKICTQCAYKEKLGCCGCIGERTGCLCRIAECCREKGCTSCKACSSFESCDKVKDCEKVPQIRLAQREKEKKTRDSELQESVFLEKWLWILFLLIIPSTVASLLKLDISGDGGSWMASAGQALEWISALAYGIILIRLSKVGGRYRTAGICTVISAVLLIITEAASAKVLQEDLELAAMIPSAIIALAGTYYEFTAHSQVAGKAGSKLSEKWQSLWVWYIGLNLGLFFGSFILLFLGVLGIIIFMGLAIGVIAVSIVKLVYLYRMAKFFRKRTDILRGNCEMN